MLPQSRVPRLGAMEEDGQKLFFNDRLFGGIPFRGQAPLLTQEELDQVESRPEARVKTFCLAEQEDLAEYHAVLNRIATGGAVRGHCERHWDAEKRCMYVYLEWYPLYNEMPAHLGAGGNNHAR